MTCKDCMIPPPLDELEVKVFETDTGQWVAFSLNPKINALGKDRDRAITALTRKLRPLYEHHKIAPFHR